MAALGRHPYRPAHLHYIIETKGHDRLVTHTFDPDYPYIGLDAVFGVKESLMAKFQAVDDPAVARAAGFDGPFPDLAFDFVLSRVGQ